MSSTVAREQLSFDSEHRLRAENLPFDIDVWYPLVREVTFHSEFLPLLQRECKAIQAFYNVSCRHTRPHLSQSEIACLQLLEKDLDVLFDRCFPHKQGAFVRLCGRSPKDGEPLHKSQVYKDYTQNLAALLSNGHEMSMHTKMTAIARTSWLKVHSGAEVMSLLLSSERVYADMLDWDRFGEPEQICLREWSPDVTMDYEFRVFVHHGQLTAVSQYDHYAFYPHLESQRDVIEQAIRALWSVVHSHLGIDSYILDVAYVPSTGACVMIELSPFLACTGPALFSWSAPDDLVVLEGKAPFEFRLKTESSLHPQLEDLLEINWDDRWNRPEEGGKHRRYDQFFETSTEDYTAAVEAEEWRKRRQRGAVCAVGLLAVGGGVLSSCNKYDDGNPAGFQAPALLASSIFMAVASFYFQATPSSRRSSAIINESKHDVAGGMGVEDSVSLFVYGTLKRGFQWNSKYLHQRTESSDLLYAQYISKAISTSKHILSVGECGVPYLSMLSSDSDHSAVSPDAGHIVGELWHVSRACLRNLDDYEGISKGYYERGEISVTVQSPDVSASVTEVKALAYFLAVSFADMKNMATVVPPKNDNVLRILQSDTSDVSSAAAGSTLAHTQQSASSNAMTLPLAEYTLAMHLSLYNPIRHIQVKQMTYMAHKTSAWGHSQQPAAHVNEEAVSLRGGDKQVVTNDEK